MRSLKRNFFDLSVLGALTLAFALVWGGPFVGTSPAYPQDQAQPQQQPNQAQPQQPQPDQAQPQLQQPQPDQAQPQQPQPDQTQPQQPQPDQSQAQTATFTGTVVKNGDQFALRDSSGAVYTLD